MSIDKKQVAARFRKRVDTYHKQAAAQRLIATLFTQKMLQKMPTTFHNVLEIGCGTGIFSELLLNNFAIGHIDLNDFFVEIKERLLPLAQKLAVPCNFMIGDFEGLDFEGSTYYDLIASTSTFQWFAHIDLALSKIHRLLNKEGLLAFTTYGPDNFIELTAHGVNSLNYLPLQALKEVVSKNFEILFCDEIKIKMAFDSVNSMLRHLQATGVNSVGYKSGTSFRSIMSKVKSNSAGKYQLTYHAQFVIAKKSNQNA